MARQPRSRNKHIPRSRGAKGNRVDRSRRNNRGVWQAIQDANSRAHQRSNHRTWKRQGLTSVKAALAGHSEDYSLSNTQLILRTMLGLLLLFPCFISTIALLDIGTLSHTQHNFWNQLMNESRAFPFFCGGIILMLGWFFSGIFKDFFLYLYVLGHELTHAFFIYLCGGKISGFKVTSDGGYVVTNKSNILIALSPYFVPFWSIILLGLSAIIGLIWDIPYHNEAVYLMIGVTWTFHLAWTLWMIPRDQPDLKENGSFFSLTIIYLANVLLLSVLLSLAPDGLSLKGYLYAWINLFTENLTAIKMWLMSWL